MTSYHKKFKLKSPWIFKNWSQ